MYFRRSICCLYIVAFIDLFAVSLFLPLLSKEIKQLGGDPVLIGAISSVYGAVQLVSSPLIGWGSDKYGTKLVLFVALLATSFAYAMQGYARVLLTLFIARAIAGVFKHTQTIAKSMIAELAPQDKSNVFGNFGAFGSMGFIIGPTIGAHLVEYEGGFKTVCNLASIAFLVNIFILVMFINTPKKIKYLKKEHSNGNNNESYCMPSSSNGKYSVLGVLALRLLFSSSTIFPRSNLPLILEEKFETSIVQVGYLNSMQGLISTLIGFAVGPVVSKFYRDSAEKMVKAAALVKTVSLLALVIAPTFRLAFLSMLFQSAADPFLRVGITTMSLDGRDDDPATILGLSQTATSLSRMIAPFAAGLAQSFSINGPFTLGVCAAAAGSILLYYLGKGRDVAEAGGHDQNVKQLIIRDKKVN